MPDNLIIAFAVALEEFTRKYCTVTHSIIYEDLDLLKTAKRQKLVKELSALTEKDIIKVKIRRVDYKDKIALLDISYKE